MALDIKSALDALKIDTAQGITLATLRTAWIAQIKPIHPDKAQNDAERKQFTEQAQIYNKANDTLINAITKLAQMHGQEPSQYVANFASVSQEQVKSIDLDFIIEWLQKSLKQRQDAEQADASISPDCAYAGSVRIKQAINTLLLIVPLDGVQVHIEGRDLWLWVKFDNAATYKALKAQYAQTFEAFDNKVFEYSKGRSQWYFARIRAAFKPRPQFYRNKNKGVTVQATEKTQIGVNVAPKLA